MAARSVCRGLLITNASMTAGDESETPTMELINNERDKANWWRPNRACLSEMLRSAGFGHADVSRTVKLTTDAPFTDQKGRSSGVEQTLYLVHARP